jgi:DNA-binding NarL/FixJ family response regulator
MHAASQQHSKFSLMSEHPIIRIVCADDHPLVRKGLAAIIAQEADLELVAEANNGREAVELYRRHRPDVLLMDLRMPELDGITATRMILAEDPAAKILALTSYDGDQDLFQALEAGVRGYLLKETLHVEIINAIRSIYAGRKLVPADVVQPDEPALRSALTPREIEVLKHIAQGLSNKEIGTLLGTAAGTVKIHVQNILEKLQAADRTQAVTIALRRGIVHL